MKGKPTPGRLLELLESFPTLRVLLLGDFVLDEYLYAEIGRVSREAPVLILDHTHTDRHPGGAANAARNLCKLGARVLPVGVVGNDSSGQKILELFRESDIETSEILVAPQWETPTKTRILAGLPHSPKQQVLRVDRASRAALPGGVTGQLLSSLRRRAPEAQGLLISDYGYGSVDRENLTAVLGVATRNGLRVTVDSRHQLSSFRGITAATPNLEEAEEILGHPIDESTEALDRAGELLLQTTGAEAILLTLGNRGAALFPGHGPTERIPASGPRDAVDVTGAGDTVISVFSLAILAGGSFSEAAHLANFAAGLAVMKRGTTPVTVPELREAIRSGASGDP